MCNFLFFVHFSPFVARRGVEPLYIVSRAGRGAARYPRGPLTA